MTPSRSGAGVTADPAHAGHALAWSTFNAVLARFGTMAVGVVLARVLGPEAFGTFAVAFVALTAILSFNELGVSLAIVRWRDDPAQIAPTVATISLASSVVFTAAGMIMAEKFSLLMGDPAAAGLVRLLCLCVLINGAVAAPAALMQRRFMQRERMVVDQVNTWVGAVISLVLALLGLGAASLVVGRLAGASLSALLFIRYSPARFHLGWSRSHVRPLLLFGMPLAGASMVTFLVGFVDQIVVGAALGSVVLGYYVLAANLANLPLSLFSQPLRSVAPALFARTQTDPRRMASDFQHITRLVLAVVLPMCAVLSVRAEDVVRFIYGAQWVPAAWAFRWLILLAACRVFFELAYDFLVVLGRSAQILVIQVVWISLLVPTLWFAVRQKGIASAAMGLVLVSVLASVPMYLTQLRRAGIQLRSLTRNVAVPLGTALAMAAVMSQLPIVLQTPAARLVAAAVLGAGVLLLLLAHFRADLSVFRRFEV